MRRDGGWGNTSDYRVRFTMRTPARSYDDDCTTDASRLTADSRPRVPRVRPRGPARVAPLGHKKRHE